MNKFAATITALVINTLIYCAQDQATSLKSLLGRNARHLEYVSSFVGTWRPFIEERHKKMDAEVLKRSGQSDEDFQAKTPPIPRYAHKIEYMKSYEGPPRDEIRFAHVLQYRNQLEKAGNTLNTIIDMYNEVAQSHGTLQNPDEKNVEEVYQKHLITTAQQNSAQLSTCDQLIAELNQWNSDRHGNEKIALLDARQQIVDDAINHANAVAQSAMSAHMLVSVFEGADAEKQSNPKGLIPFVAFRENRTKKHITELLQQYQMSEPADESKLLDRLQSFQKRGNELVVMMESDRKMVKGFLTDIEDAILETDEKKEEQGNPVLRDFHMRRFQDYEAISEARQRLIEHAQSIRQENRQPLLKCVDNYDKTLSHALEKKHSLSGIRRAFESMETRFIGISV